MPDVSAIDAHVGIPINECRHAQRLGVEQPARHRDGITPDIEQHTAAVVHATAHVIRVATVVTEVARDQGQVSDASRGDQLASLESTADVNEP